MLIDEENDCRFELQRKEHWIHTPPTWSIAVRKRLLKFCDLTSLMLQYALTLDVIQVLDGSLELYSILLRQTQFLGCLLLLSFSDISG